MQTKAPPITRHKLARLYAFAMLWLGRVVASCVYWAARGEPPERRELDRVAVRIQKLIFLSAIVAGIAGRPTRNRHGRLKHVTWRIILGARLRRAARGKTWAERVFAIMALIRDAKHHIARLVRRLRCGLTRLRTIAAARGDAPAFACACAPVAAADSS